MTFEIGLTGRVFNLYEAQAQMPLVKSITKKHQIELAPIQLRLNKMLSNDPRRSQLEVEYEAVVRRWRTKIEQLGAQVAGLWVVEFDTGEGSLCWRHPELSLSFFRAKGASFVERERLNRYIENCDPDWAR